jgi:hypothetical protein
MSFIAIRFLHITSANVDLTTNTIHSNNLGKFELTNIP